jgi:hypothetical protein
MKWRDRAARALDLTHEAEQHKLGISLGRSRYALARWLDGDFKLSHRTVRLYVKYCEAIAKAKGE